MKTIAYLGPEKTNTHIAAKRYFGAEVKYLPAGSVEKVFELVERKKADFGVVAIENSLEGGITHTLDRFIDFEESPIKIYGEIDEPIHHYLMYRPNTSLQKIRLVYSHYSALAQCKSWLSTHLSYAGVREADSTAKAVDDLFDKKASVFPLDERAAIGRVELAEERNLKAVRIPIEQENRTRFLILSLEKNKKRGKRNKTSLMLILSDRPGALYGALRPFKTNHINLMKIESRPSKRKAWEYVFFIDFEGHESESRVKKTLQALKHSAATVRVLGSYPVGDIRGRG
jgi:chorismate mutase/prephenate dehydratase